MSDLYRLRSLGDPSSAYYKTLVELLRDGAVQQELAERSRAEVVVPFPVATEVRLELEEKFCWKLKTRDFGYRPRLAPRLAALTYLMWYRNVTLMGGDGEEVIYIDGDLPALVAKGMTYGHVCRTHASARLQAGYAFEDGQLVGLANTASGAAAASARALMRSMREGDDTRVCENAATCVRGCDTIMINHVMTPCSLKQAVFTARAHRASTVRGVCFFQPEMLCADEGELAAFPGKFRVDRRTDVISFLPDEDPSRGFSHPYSSLMSFFLNHEYCDGEGRWLIEKHLSHDGIFHYLLRKESLDSTLEELLEANYYHADLTEWVEYEYPSYYDEVNGVMLSRPKRRKARILRSVSDKVMSLLMVIDPKRLTLEEVFSALRRHNNLVVCGGDTVKKPRRVWYDVLSAAAVPMLALAQVRRAAASYELKVGLQHVQDKFAIADSGTATLLWLAMCKKLEALRRVSLVSLVGSKDVSLEGLVKDGCDMSVVVRTSSEFVTVAHQSGISRELEYGREEAWLPAKRVRSLDLLARAYAFVSRSGSESSMPVGVPGADSEVSVLDSHQTGGEGSHGVTHVVEQEEDVEEVARELTDKRRKLCDELLARQDALSLGAHVRTVTSFEDSSVPGIAAFPPLLTDPVAVAQEDYDLLCPGVSTEDEEIKPWMVFENDFERNSEFKGVISDSKREIPKSMVIRRSRLRTAGTGRTPQSQLHTMSALFKRNADVPVTRGYLDLKTFSGKVIDRIVDVCYVDNWRGKLVEAIDSGLWQCNEVDVESYVDNLGSEKISAIMQDYFSCADEDLTRWMLMVKAVAKPPMDLDASAKVQVPQSIMYSEQKAVNAKYSAMQTRFFKVFTSLLRPNISFNNRESPAEHELWFNSCQPLRDSADNVFAYEGDIFCYDRSQEHAAQVMEMAFYRYHGLNEETLAKWAETHGLKKATSMMFGVVMWFTLQGLSGIWKTLFRNGLLCLSAVVWCTQVKKESLLVLDVVGDDFTLETNEPVDTGMTVEGFAFVFNFTAKFFNTYVLYCCSKYWVRVDGWWYFMQDPWRKIESVSNAVVVSDRYEEKMHEKWVSLRSDLRHYGNSIVMEALVEAMTKRLHLTFRPYGLVRALATFAESSEAFFKSYGPEEVIGSL